MDRGDFFTGFGIDAIGMKPVDNAPFLEIVRSHLDFHIISRENAHAMDAHSSCKVTEQLMVPGLRCQNPHTERGIRKRLFHFAHKHKNILRHRAAMVAGKCYKKPRKVTDLSPLQQAKPPRKFSGYKNSVDNF